MTIRDDIIAAMKTAGADAFYHEAPQHATQPFIVFKQAESEPLNTLDGYAGITRTAFVFDAWAQTPEEAEALRDLAVTTILANTGSLANHASLPAGENAKDTDTNSYMETCSFSIWHP